MRKQGHLLDIIKDQAVLNNAPPSNNFHYKGKAGGAAYQPGFAKPNFDIPKSKPKYCPPSISDNEKRRREAKEKEREEIRRQVEERERK